MGDVGCIWRSDGEYYVVPIPKSFYSLMELFSSIPLLGDIEPKTELDVMAISQSFDSSAAEPFRLLRNTLLEAEPYIVYQDYVLAKCLDECLYRDVDL